MYIKYLSYCRDPFLKDLNQFIYDYSHKWIGLSPLRKGPDSKWIPISMRVNPKWFGVYNNILLINSKYIYNWNRNSFKEYSKVDSIV